MIVFEKAGKQNTEKTLEMAAMRARRDNVHLVVASSRGGTAEAAVRAAEDAGILDKLVIVGSVVDAGFEETGVAKYALLEAAADIRSLEQVFIITEYTTDITE